MLIDFEYDIGQEVEIIAIGTKARITWLEVVQSGKRFGVIYWIDGERKSEALFDWELRHA